MPIDCNTHPSGDGKWFGSSFDARISYLLSLMDKAGVDSSVIIPFDKVNDLLIVNKLYQQFPDRLIKGIAFNPALYTHEDIAVKELQHILHEANGDLRIIKFHNRLHNFSLNDERFHAVLEYNNSLSIPLLVYHCGLILSNNEINTEIPPIYFANLAQRYGNTTFIIMHMGGTWMMQVYEAIKATRNIYFDLSFALTKYKASSCGMDISFLMNNFDQRTLWGSDFPEVSPVQAMLDFNDLAEGLPDHKRQNILSQNILKLLHGSN